MYGRPFFRRTRDRKRDNPRKNTCQRGGFPFNKFPGVDPILGPEMKSTGEVMGTGDSFGSAFAKAVLAAGILYP